MTILVPFQKFIDFYSITAVVVLLRQKLMSSTINSVAFCIDGQTYDYHILCIYRIGHLKLLLSVCFKYVILIVSKKGRNVLNPRILFYV